LIIFCKIIRSSFDRIPYWVQIEKSKMEFRRREALTVKLAKVDSYAFYYQIFSFLETRM